jgi:predicted adenylyl cyclase CyaB
MASNVEWKARARDPQRQRGLAERLADGPPELREQVDTFFAAPRGRLKLRRLSAGQGELIRYDRPDQAGPKRSDYAVVPTDRPDALRDLLALALGVRGEVRKRRWLYRAGPARVHFDEVEGLGAFLEVEVSAPPGQPIAEAERLAEELRRRLDVLPGDLIDVAYVDLLAAAQAP